MTAEEINDLTRSLNASLVETHISWVLLTTSRAYKIKKPVIFSFLDFSKLEDRQTFCLEEVKLNRRLTDIYLDVIPVRKNGRNINISKHDEGEVIDYAVCMKKMEANKRMDLAIKFKKITEADVNNLADKIASFHLGANVVTTPEDMHFVNKRFKDIEAVSDWVGHEFGYDRKHIIEKAVECHMAFVEKNFEIMDERVRRGFKLDVHGDLHNQNIYIYKDPVVFDCIEFNPKYRQIDVMNEIAFLCMDMEAKGRKDLSTLFLSKYQEKFPCIFDEKDEKLFQYYKLYRANVKVKVNGLRCMQGKKSAGYKEHHANISDYLNLMDEYLKNFPNPGN
jgi:aminoglycoside phosphotransferase family enzyme